MVKCLNTSTPSRLSHKSSLAYTDKHTKYGGYMDAVKLSAGQGDAFEGKSAEQNLRKFCSGECDFEGDWCVSCRCH